MENSDKEFVSYLREITKNTSLYLYLNNASREAVEDSPGNCPLRPPCALSRTV